MTTVVSDTSSKVAMGDLIITDGVELYTVVETTARAGGTFVELALARHQEGEVKYKRANPVRKPSLRALRDSERRHRRRPPGKSAVRS